MSGPATDQASVGPFDLSMTPIHVGEGPASPQTDFKFDFPSFEKYIAQHCRPDAAGHLIMIETSPTDWPAWECHKNGDEVVIVLEGKADFIQEVDGEERSLAVGPGTTLINHAGVWHTANVKEPLKAIYITPCPGTEHRPRS